MFIMVIIQKIRCNFSKLFLKAIRILFPNHNATSCKYQTKNNIFDLGNEILMDCLFGRFLQHVVCVYCVGGYDEYT